MRNGLVVASPARAEEAERAARWLASQGGRLEVLGDAGSPAWLAVVHDGGPVLEVGRDGRRVGVRIGDPTASPWAVLDGDPPAHTVAAVIDPEHGRAVVGSGPGNLRLFGHEDPSGWLVTTSVGALVEGLGERAALDRSYEDFQLGFGFLPDDRTMFAGVRSLARPGCIALAGPPLAGPSGDAPRPGAAEPVPPPDGPHGVADLLLEVLDEQSRGVDHVGVLLGGFDSALVAAGLHRLGKRVSTFTFHFDDDRFNQRHVEEAVGAAAADHHPVPITAEVIGDALARFPELVNQPGAQPHYQIQTIVAASAARAAGVERLFSGDGCDAVFLAYPTVNTRSAASQGLGRVPSPVLRASLRALSLRSVDDRLGHVARVGRSSLRAALLGGAASHHLPTQYLDDVALRRLSPTPRPVQDETIAEIRRRLATATGATDPVRLAFDGNAIAGHSLAKVEGATLVSGLDIHSPYTTTSFRESIAQMPPELVRPAGRLAAAEGKPVLQQAAVDSGLLPPSVVEQRKQAPTMAPIDEWFSGPLRGQVTDLLMELPFEVDLAAVDVILRRKRAEDVYRQRLTLSNHAFQAIGLLTSYAAFARLVRR
ncbi:asparagine synthase-related protein [Actinomarinicola tropica]|uniref:Asparagine synthetase domain-containing protein n=1 Tax=Actinomarinicola tropica TaxID=2789776 RepID=A0A5Q2RPP2_9ACTN|nr:asparagine synthase-related protein [Actinomarinicola tropica]QGG95850.1 hypothetical protein GH723_12495 [Actinomarinicola tropica]